jgi:hypothetical protein
MDFVGSWRYQISTFVALGVCLLLTSCGKSGPELHPVRGQVLFEGQPAAGVQVVFQPAEQAEGQDLTMPSGRTGDDGSFTLQTHPHGEGAPAGEYIVLATWYPANGREVDNPKNKLSPKYANPGEPLLKATVKAGDNQLEPFRLTK